MVIYLLLVNIAVIISYSLYYFSFRKLTFFHWNRAYLLSTIFFALLIPIGLFIDLSTFFEDDIIIPMVNVHDYIDIPIVVYAQQTSSLYLVDVFKWVYLTGLIGSVSIMLWRLWNVHKMFKTDAPFLGFSFFNKMFLGKEVKSYKSIERHEEIHIEQGHSYDVLLMELFKALNWFNPVVYHLSKEIKFQHECIADELSSEDKVAYAELLVAHALQVPQNVLVHEFSNQSFLKKRIMMLFKNKSSNNKRFLYLGIIPAVLVVGLSTIVFNTSRAKGVIAKVESKMEDVKLHIANPAVNNEVMNAKLEGEVKVFGDTVAIPKDSQAFIKWCKNRLKEGNLLKKEGNSVFHMNFTVESTGKLADLVVTNQNKKPLPEVEKVFADIPNWLPAVKNGKAISSQAYFLLGVNEEGKVLLSSNTDRVVLSLEEKEEIRKKAIEGMDDDVVLSQTEISPEPPWGLSAYRKWIGENFKYSKAAIDAKVKGTVHVSFIVEKDGSLSDIKFIRDIGHGTGEAAMELIKTSKKWSPGIQNGRVVRFEYLLPIRIDLTNVGEIQERLPRAEPALGYNQLRKRINDNFKFPRALNSKDIDPYIFLKFEVAPDGKITPNGAKSDLGIEFIAELSKHIENSKWIPATVNGQKVKSEGSIWIKFDRSGKIIEEYTRVEVTAEPKGGVSTFRKFISSYYEFPTALLDKNESGNVELKFEIDGDGNPKNIKIVKESHKDIGLQLESLIKKNGTWTPAIIDGKKMKFAFSMTINLNYIEGGGVINVGNLQSLGFIKS